MRIAVFSDIHSNYHALEAVLADIKSRGADQLICLGDITLKGPQPKECVERVRDLGCPTVLGNTDVSYHPDFHPARFPTRDRTQLTVLQDFDRHLSVLSSADRAWLASRPLTHTAWIDQRRLDFFHASPQSNYVLILPWAGNEELEKLRLAPETVLSAFGHSHRAFVRFLNGQVLVNPGSVGLPFDGDPRPSYALLDLNQGELGVQICRVPYDYEAAIRTAQQVHMAGWELFAHTARTGHYAG